MCAFGNIIRRVYELRKMQGITKDVKELFLFRTEIMMVDLWS